MKATQEQLDKLAPFLAGAIPDGRGELEMFCPLHNDTRRSMSLNVEMGCFFCHAGCGGGSISRLIDAEDTWIAAEGRTTEEKVDAGFFRESIRPDEQAVKRWHRRLMNSGGVYLDELWERRGIEVETARRARIGHNGRYYKIPIHSPEGDLWNVRTYDMDAPVNRRKIWSVRGMGRARLYPASVLERLQVGDNVLICEGEWDALLAIQHGFAAVTRTDGAGKPWKPNWSVGFAGLNVYLCHDRDDAGYKSDLITADALEHVARRVYQIELPYEMKEKNGKDLSDFLMESDTPTTDLLELSLQARRLS